MTESETMDTQEFYVEMNELGSFFNKKLNVVQQDHWYKEIKKYGRFPNRAIREVFRDCRNSGGVMPTTNKVKAMLYEWMEHHPEARSKEARLECPECDGEGAFRVWYRPAYPKGFVVWKKGKPYGRELWYARDLPCAECHNWKRRFPPEGDFTPKRRWTKEEAVRVGFLLKDPDLDPSQNLDREFVDIDTLLEATTKRMA